MTSEPCRYCGGAILWAKTPTGKSMPIDLEPVDMGNVRVVEAGSKEIQMTAESLARQAYIAYGDHTGWKNFAGLAMPQWEELPVGIRIAWQCAVIRVIDQIFATARHAILRPEDP